MKGCRWHFLPLAPAEYFDSMAAMPRLLAQLLYNRHVADVAQAEAFLAGDQRLESDPGLLPDIERAVPRIGHALATGEKIAVYGDFDVDGIAATAAMVQGLSLLAGNVIPYIPHRFNEGYGLNESALQSLAQQGVTLVITVDCGTSGSAEVSYARDLGLDIIVTDHHSVPASLPPALAIINPKRAESRYPCRDLAGTGVAFKLVQALCRELAPGTNLDCLRDLVALGTVADIVPLLGENRYLVKSGLEQLNRVQRPGLVELMLRTGLEPGAISTESIAWVLAPRLNAAGRLNHAMTSYDLLTARDTEQALELAAQLDEQNTRRQALTQQVLESARKQAAALGADLPLIMVGEKDYAAGVVGIVAGRLVDEFYRPALVLELGAETSRGSARSVPEFDIIAALRQCSDLLLRFGGHPAAAGFTLESHNLDELRRRLLELARHALTGTDLRPLLCIDARIRLSSLNGEVVRLIRQLQPFGYGNPAPVFFTPGVEVINCRTVGREGEHLRLKLRHGHVVWDSIGFGLGRHLAQMTPLIDIVYNLGTNSWSDRELLELNILDMAPSPKAT